MKIASLLGIVLIGVFLSNIKSRESRVHARHGRSAHIDWSPRALSSEEHEIVDKTMRLFSQNLMLVTIGHERGEELLRLFIGHHIPVVTEQLGNGRIGFRTSRSSNPTQLSFLAAPWDEDETFASFIPQARILRIGTRSMSSCWFGFIAAHEMVHIDDFVSGRESIALPGSDEFIAGEVRAHELEFELIERWTKGTFWTVIGRMKQRLAQSGRTQPVLEDFREADALFPVVESAIEREARNRVYLLALYFSRIEQGLDNAERFIQKMHAYRKLTENLP